MKKNSFNSLWISAVFFIVFNLNNIHISFGQTIVFNNRLVVENRSTILRNILINDDSLLISGELGTDSLGLAGLFLLYVDSLGNMGTIKKYRDPSLQDHALLDGRNPIMINANKFIVLSGHYLDQDNAYFMILNKQLDTIVYNDYSSNYRSMVIHDIVELNYQYFIIGRVQTLQGDGNVYIQNIDSTGKKVWERTYGIPSKNETGRAAIVENGGITVMISESFDDTPNELNDTRYWIRFMHIDTSGAILNDWREEVTGHEGWAGTLVKYEDDYIYTTNKIGEEIQFGPLTAGQIVRRDSSFNLVWRKQYGEIGTPFDGLGDMIIAKDSNLLVTGQILDESRKYVLERVMKLTPSGDSIWEARDTGRILGNGESLNIMEGIAEIESGSVFAVGYTFLGGGFYEGLILKINNDGCVDTICTTSTIDRWVRLLKEDIIVYPNPANNIIKLEWSEKLDDHLNVSIVDMMGNRILDKTILDHQSELSINNLPSGLYLIEFFDKNKFLGIRKFIKQ